MTLIWNGLHVLQNLVNRSTLRKVTIQFTKQASQVFLSSEGVGASLCPTMKHAYFLHFDPSLLSTMLLWDNDRDSSPRFR